MKTRVTELPGIEYPIFRGGMAWVAAAVAFLAAEEGGVHYGAGARRGRRPVDVKRDDRGKPRQLHNEPHDF